MSASPPGVSDLFLAGVGTPAREATSLPPRTVSSSLEVWPFFPRERSHATSVIGGAAGAVLKISLHLEEVFEPASHRRVQPLLRQGERFGGAARERRRKLAPAV